jgi:hypothetical protein
MLSDIVLVEDHECLRVFKAKDITGLLPHRHHNH